MSDKQYLSYPYDSIIFRINSSRKSACISSQLIKVVEVQMHYASTEIEKYDVVSIVLHTLVD